MRNALDGWIKDAGDRGASERTIKSLLEVARATPTQWLKILNLKMFETRFLATT
tara:strand:+ start:65839 stop:66000 length:162 start_codon:yes stop_codon:yes gene_type:complete